MNLWDLYRALPGAGRQRESMEELEIVVEANGFVLGVEQLDVRGSRIVLVAETPKIEDVFAALERIQRTVSETMEEVGAKVPDPPPPPPPRPLTPTYDREPRRGLLRRRRS